MRRIAAIALVPAACAFSLRGPAPGRSLDKPPRCSLDGSRADIDFSGAVLFGLVGGAGVANWLVTATSRMSYGRDEEFAELSGITGASLLGIATIYGLSAFRGRRVVARCRAAVRDFQRAHPGS
jgi:hypothetical protein